MIISRYLTLTSIFLGISAASFANVAVIPRPLAEHPAKADNKTDGVFNLSPTGLTVEAADELKNEKQRWMEFHQSGLIPKEWSLLNGKANERRIVLSIDSSLPGEGYVMNVTPAKLEISGGSPAGVFYGIQSLKQMTLLLIKDGKKALPAMKIQDQPVCEWRGVMLDTARHYMEKEFILKFIDMMSLYKLNRLHWHLVDSEAWRLEIKKYPKLVEVSQNSPREYPSEDPTNKTRPAKFMYGDFHGGGYYTQEDVKEIVAYAKARHIEIMPEIEFPGHSMAALTAYPEFGTTGKVPTVKSNHSPDLIAPNEKGIGFLKDVLDETMELFPFGVIHFGGDEAPKVQWKESAEVQAKIKELGLKDENQLQAWMFNELAAHIAQKGRRPAGWEEIMHDHNMETLTKDAIIYPWLSSRNAVKSANAGLGVIHSQTGTFYLDSWQTSSPADNWTLYRGPLTLKKIYSFNLFPEGLTEEGKKNIYGAQGFLWTELITKPEHVEYQGYPRLTALAELLWTSNERKDYEDYYKRLEDHAYILDAYKINYRYIDPSPIVKWNPELLRQGDIIVDLTPDVQKSANGEMIVQLSYQSGASALEINKVELLSNGKVIAVDEHDGITGNTNNDNTYRLKYSGRQGPMQLRISHDNSGSKSNSHGDVTIFTGKGLALFDPRNFAGGDYPSASWTTGDTAKELSTLRIPVDGIVLKPGPHELIVNLKQSKSPVLVGGVKVVGTAGPGSAFKDVATLGKDSATAILPVLLTESDITQGSSLMLNIKSANPSSGDVRVRLTKEIESSGNGQYKWSPNIFEGGAAIVYAKDVQAGQNGAVTVRFDYKGGANGLDITVVQLIENGTVVAESKRQGFAGSNPKDNSYELQSPAIKAGAAYQLRMNIRGSGGNDTNGIVTVK